MISFFEAILPNEGHRIGLALPGKTQRGFKTNHELEQFLTHHAATQDVYHACATFKMPQSRTQANVESVRSVWLDYDFRREGHDVAAAMDRLHEFCDSIDLPDPLVVYSGGGLHAYWPFERSACPDEWRPLANGLRQAAERFGLDVDGGCTIDICRVLRPPGSWNRKPDYDAPVRVEWLQDAGPYEIDEIARSLSVERHVVVPGAPPHDARLPGTHANAPSQRAARNEFDIPYDGPSPSGNDVAGQCAQLAYFRDTGCALAGEEPMWKAALGVLAFCSDGEELAHAWSAKDQRYAREETQAKIDERRKLTGATTCLHFEGLNRSRCIQCSLHGQLNSPITSVSAVHSPNVSISGAIESEGMGEHFPSPEHSVNGYNGYQCPEGFKYVKGNLVFNQVGKKDIEQEVIAQNQYIHLISVGRGEASNAASYRFSIKCPNEQERFIRVGAGDVLGARGTSALGDHGLFIDQPTLFKKYILSSAAMLRSEMADAREYEKFGWKDDGFLWGDQLYGAKGAARVPIGKALEERAKFLRMGGQHNRGSLEEWKHNARGLLQIGFEPQRVALLASVGAIFVNFIAPLEGGAIIHFVFPHSGTGKSTSLKIAASVWGDLEGLRTTVQDTRSSQGIKFGLLSHLPIIFEELIQRDPNAAEQLLQIFTTGTDKARATSGGEMLQANNRIWATIMLSAANVSLLSVLRGAGRSTAMAERVLEFSGELPNHNPVEGDRYVNGLMNNCGFAGDAVLRFMLAGSNMAAIRQMLEDEYQTIMERYGWSSTRRYWARTLACLSVAGGLLNRIKLVEFDPSATVEWMAKDLDQRHKREMAEKLSPTELIAQFINEHTSHMLTVAAAFNPGYAKGTGDNHVKLEPRMGTIYIRHEEDPPRFFIDKAVLTAWLVKRDELPRSFYAKMLEDKMITEKKSTLGAGTKYAGGQVPVIIIDGDKL